MQILKHAQEKRFAFELRHKRKREQREEKRDNVRNHSLGEAAFISTRHKIIYGSKFIYIIIITVQMLAEEKK